jgi:hypothetical protein
MATKYCGIFLNVLVKRKIGKFCETFKTQKIERENMHVIENWV